MKISGIICFGDSILAGTGASDRELGCAKLLKSCLGIPVLLRGRNWNTSQDGLERLEADVLKQRDFSHVLILFGNNDCWLVGPNRPKIPLGRFRANLISMIEQIERNNQVPILCNLQPIDFDRFAATFPELLEYKKNMEGDPSILQKQYSGAIEDWALEFNWNCVDIRSELEKHVGKVIAPDGIHPNDFGHKIIADRVFTFLKKIDFSLEVLPPAYN